MDRTHTVEDAVTIDDPTSSESMYHGPGRIFCE